MKCKIVAPPSETITARIEREQERKARAAALREARRPAPALTATIDETVWFSWSKCARTCGRRMAGTPAGNRLRLAGSGSKSNKSNRSVNKIAPSIV